ncbi:hypothetical protein PFICI_02623 [Pestalotiopsis fici W106-1]|uniref:Hemerythrin-like domain-containing protein n=1 Tax=Pestalotiopsis fici (strain W106-1 / CGMCC3.15140) TaxID=1229662 RepID=W3XER9_PESFW|nr:uncharacterized protein PFICI_02623 [Pestalotiopsis fici W106-1]ETS84598.1 hypothetical protein PFICI_02623 [Pestalotiopsis fici W106-1]
MAYWFESPFPLVPTPFAALAEGEQQDVFVATATEMTLAHNILIRGLNSIYRQAPFIKTLEQQDFVGYAKNFVNVLKVHHEGEEESFFAEVEKMTGEAGIMEKNVEEHHEFHGGLEELQGYLTRIADGAEAYNGKHIVEIIDKFGPGLSEHLSQEIQTLLELRRFGPDKMKGLATALAADGQANLKKIGLAGGVVYVFLSHDKTWENGIWADFPPAPPGVKTLVMRGLYYWHSAWWKFSPCDQNFMPKAEPYAKPE